MVSRIRAKHTNCEAVSASRWRRSSTGDGTDSVVSELFENSLVGLAIAGTDPKLLEPDQHEKPGTCPPHARD